MGAILDLARVLLSPSEVYGRVREAPKILLPLLALMVIQVVISAASLPYVRAAMRAQIASQPESAQGAGQAAETIATVGALVGGPISVAVILLIAAFLLWVIVSVLGGDARFKHLFSVSLYAWVPAILLQVAGMAVLMLKGTEGITSMQDLQPSLGLDLFLAPMMELGAFMGALLRSVNPFSIWQIVLVTIGVRVTHNVEKGTAMSAAIGQWAVLALVGALFAMLGAGAQG
jgi:hypothetical protein